MLADERYMTRTDFLPMEGYIYIDTSMGWVCPIENKESREDEKMAFQKLRGFRGVFRKRGMVSTTPLILEEIKKNVYHYEEQKDFRRKAVKRTNSVKNYSSNSKGLRDIQRTNEGWRDSYNKSRRFYDVYKDIYEVLKKGMEMYSPDIVVSLEKVHYFIYRRGEDELSLADKELVYTALVAGNGHGILSADKPLLEKYMVGSKIFDLPGAFICDAINGITLPAMDWQKSL